MAVEAVGGGKEGKAVATGVGVRLGVVGVVEEGGPLLQGTLN